MSNRRWRPTVLLQASVALHVLVLTSLVLVPGRWCLALAVLLANHLLLTAVGLWPRSHWLGPNLTRLPAASAARNEIALTIDDGPDPEVTPKVLNLLERYGVLATFFCIGDRAAQHPDLCREIARRGHCVENHSQRHRHSFSLLGPAGLAHELHAAQVTLTGITGEAPLFFRAPAGLRNPFLDPVLTHFGLRLTSWSARGYDTRVGDIELVKSRLLKKLRAGAILLMHDGNAARTAGGQPVILEVLPDLLEVTRASGLHFVTLRKAVA